MSYFGILCVVVVFCFFELLHLHLAVKLEKLKRELAKLQRIKVMHDRVGKCSGYHSGSISRWFKYLDHQGD